jgi:hypothetical protein
MFKLRRKDLKDRYVGECSGRTREDSELLEQLKECCGDRSRGGAWRDCSVENTKVLDEILHIL